MEKPKTYLKLETIEENGIALAFRGDREELLIKITAMLNAVIEAGITNLEELKLLLEVIEESEKRKLPLVAETSPEEFDEKLKKADVKRPIKRKCLVCPEKDTCKNKWLDIKCNKY